MMTLEDEQETKFRSVPKMNEKVEGSDLNYST